MSEEVALIKARLAELDSFLLAVQQEKQQLEQDLAEIEARRTHETYAGWQKFHFRSSYYGSHYERGEGDEEMEYLFHPEVDISRWKDVEFSHGSYGWSETYGDFLDWLDTLSSDQFREPD